MAKNRFEQVDEIQPDAILLTLKRDGDGAVGSVSIPASATGGRIPQDMVTGFAAAQDAFRNAIRLANQSKVPVVVLDPDNLWNAEWGELYRPLD
ncbi:MAG: hypothetical protein JSS22_09165 [Proteobacteria bacterium]|nr:hypothetical protein [Pseudomonadota bacterium]